MNSVSVTYWLHIRAQCQLTTGFTYEHSVSYLLASHPTGFTHEHSVSYLLASHMSSVSATYWLHIWAQCLLASHMSSVSVTYWLHIRAQCQLPTGFTYELSVSYLLASHMSSVSTGFTYELSVSYLLASHTSSVSVTYWLHILLASHTSSVSVTYWLHIWASSFVSFATKSSATARFAVTTPFKVIQGHWFWYQLKACMLLLLVNNTNVHPISHRFWVTAQCRSNYRLWLVVPIVNAFVLSNLCEYCHKLPYIL